MVEQNGKISVRQAFFFATVINAVNIARVLPTYLAGETGEAAWLPPVITGLLTFGAVLIFGILIRSFSGTNPVDIFKIILGKPIGTFLGMLIFLWLILILTCNVRYAGNTVILQLYRGGDVRLAILILLAVVGFLLNFKFRILARMNEIMFIFIFLSYLIMFIASISYIHTENLMPVGFSDVPKILSSGGGSMGIISIGLCVFFLTDKIEHSNSFKKPGIWFSGFILIFSMLIILITVGSFGAAFTAKSELPYYTAVRQIDIFGGFDRIDFFEAGITCTSEFITTALLFFVALTFLKGLFSFQNTKGFIWIFVLLIGVISYSITNSVFELDALYLNIIQYGNIIFIIGVPLLLVTIAKIRNMISPVKKT